MKNSENKIKKQNDSRVFAYKAISLASLSTLALTLGLNNLKEAKALMGKTGTIRFFGTSNSRVIKPGNMGSTGATGYSVKSAVPGGGTKVTGGALTNPGRGFANFNKKLHNPFTQPYLDSIKTPNTGSSPSNKTSSTKAPTTNGTNGTSKLPTTGSGSLSSNSSLSSGLSRNPSTSSSSSTSSTLSRPSSGSNNASVGVYENPTNGNNNTNGNKKLTPKQKVGLVTVGSLGVLGVLAAVGVGVGAAQNTNNKSDSNGTKGPESVPTPKDPTNSDKVVNSALGNNYTDTKA